MTSRIILILNCLLFNAWAIAAHIDATSLYSLHAIAQVTGSTGNWNSYDGSTVDSAADWSRVSDTIVSGSGESVLFNTFVWSEDDTHSTLTLGFGTDMIGNRPGHDLAIFAVGPATIDVTIAGMTVRHSSSSIIIDGVLQGVFSNNHPPVYLDTLDVILIDLDAYAGIDYLNQLTIDALTEIENPLTWPGISAVGAFNTTMITPDNTVVPLPLPIVLMGSGLVLLGYVGRRKR